MRRLIPLVFSVLLLSSAKGLAQAPAEAPPEAPAPDVQAAPEDTRPPEEIAREAYALGESLYASGAYAEAEEAFIRAYRAVANPVVLIAIAESRARLERGAAAVEVLERYLTVRPNAADAEAVRARIALLRETPGRVHFETTPAGASISVDGEETGLVTPADVELPAGTHTVRVSLDGYEPVEGPLAVLFATRHIVQQALVVLTPETPDAPDVSDVDEDEAPAPRRLSPALMTTMSVAGASLIAGTVLGYTALSRESEYKRSPSESTAEEGERFALFADLAFGVSLAATASSVVLYLTSREDTAEDEDATPEDAAPTVSFAPAIGRTVRGGVLTVQF